MATTVEQLREVVALVRSWGFTVTTEPGWETRCGKSVWTPCNAEFAVEHWTASPNTPTAYLRDGDPVRRLGTLCNVQLKRDATLHLIAGGYANHAGYVDPRTPEYAANPPMDREVVPGADSATYSANRYSVGMEGNAGVGAPYTDAQHAAATAWWAACTIVFGWSPTAPPILAHKEITRRKPGDPSHDMAARRRQVAAFIAAKQEEDMALTDADIDRIADRVLSRPIRLGASDKETSLYTEVQWLAGNFAAQRAATTAAAEATAEAILSDATVATIAEKIATAIAAELPGVNPEDIASRLQVTVRPEGA